MTGLGEGFLLRVNNVGVVQWSFTYNTGETTNDFFEKVSTFEDFTFGVVGSLEADDDIFFRLLKLDSNGGILNHQRIGYQETVTLAFQRNVFLLAQNANFAVAVFRTAANDMISGTDLNAGTETLLAYPGYTKSRILSGTFNSDQKYHLINLQSNSIYISIYNGPQASRKLLDGTDGLFADTAWAFDVDYDSTLQKTWTILSETEIDNRIWLIYAELDTVDIVTSSYIYYVSPFDMKAEFVTITYVSETECYATAMIANGTGVILRVTNADLIGSGAMVLYTINQLTATSSITASLKDSSLRIITAAPAGPVGTTNSQAVIFETDLTLDFNVNTFFVPGTLADTTLTLNSRTDNRDVNPVNMDLLTAVPEAGDDLAFETGGPAINLFLTETEAKGNYKNTSFFCYF